MNDEGSIDPQIASLPILDPRQHVGKKIQELGEVRRDLAGGHRDERVAYAADRQ
jgi:hypothetical protein